MSSWFARYGFAEVFPDLYVGAYPQDEVDVETLAVAGVTRVLNLVEDSEYGPGARGAAAKALGEHGIEEIRLGLVDFGHLPPEQLERAVQTVLGWMHEGVCGYIHCRAGRQRSVAVAVGAVAVFNDVDISTALGFIRKRKPSADPLPHQHADLTEWWIGRQGADA